MSLVNLLHSVLRLQSSFIFSFSFSCLSLSYSASSIIHLLFLNFGIVAQRFICSHSPTFVGSTNSFPLSKESSSFSAQYFFVFFPDIWLFQFVHDTPLSSQDSFGCFIDAITSLRADLITSHKWSAQQHTWFSSAIHRCKVYHVLSLLSKSTSSTGFRCWNVVVTRL